MPYTYIYLFYSQMERSSISCDPIIRNLNMTAQGYSYKNQTPWDILKINYFDNFYNNDKKDPRQLF